ncbi:MAG TPA: AIR synthase-related protein, partial [Mycobacterium sp.]|nr:AIR synthase-related protein [Mycobacterium sp.]
YAGAQLALAEAYRNVAVTGATPIAVTNCLNFGSPEDPGVMWQFSEAVRGLADGCAALGIPVTGGNVSFYNQTGTTAILPTPVVGVLGVLDDVRRRIPTGLGTEPGEALLLLGDTRDEFDGSIWAQVSADHLGGRPPEVDLAREQLLAEVLSAASRDGLVSAAHDLSEGGLIQAVVEAALTGETGCRIVIPEEWQEGTGPFTFLFSESAGRVLVAVPRTEESRFRSMCEARGLPVTRIGVVDQGSDALEVQDQFTVSLEDLRSTSEGVLPGLFG